MIYSEAAYFDGYHYAHIVAYEEHKQTERNRIAAAKRAAIREKYKERSVKFESPVHAMQAAIETRYAIRSCA